MSPSSKGADLRAPFFQFINRVFGIFFGILFTKNALQSVLQGISAEDEICSGAGRLRTSRTVREQSAGADAAAGRFLLVASPSRERALGRPATQQKCRTGRCGICLADCIARRGRKSTYTSDNVKPVSTSFRERLVLSQPKSGNDTL